MWCKTSRGCGAGVVQSAIEARDRARRTRWTGPLPAVMLIEKQSGERLAFSLPRSGSRVRVPSSAPKQQVERLEGTGSGSLPFVFGAVFAILVVQMWCRIDPIRVLMHHITERDAW